MQELLRIFLKADAPTPRGLAVFISGLHAETDSISYANARGIRISLYHAGVDLSNNTLAFPTLLR